MAEMVVIRERTAESVDDQSVLRYTAPESEVAAAVSGVFEV